MSGTVKHMLGDFSAETQTGIQTKDWARVYPQGTKFANLASFSTHFGMPGYFPWNWFQGSPSPSPTSLKIFPQSFGFLVPVIPT